jgi:hypothetical protein
MLLVVRVFSLGIRIRLDETLAMPQLFAIVVVSKAPRVHSRELRMASLTRDRNGTDEARICVSQARERLLHGAASLQRGLWFLTSVGGARA